MGRCIIKNLSVSELNLLRMLLKELFDRYLIELMESTDDEAIKKCNKRISSIIIEDSEIVDILKERERYIMNNIDNNEVAKHRKKSKYKGEKRANHKHVYVEALADLKGSYHRLTHCTICGRINDKYIFETIPIEDNINGRRLLTNEEVYEKYKHLPRVTLNELDDKYVTLVTEGE